MDIRTGSQPASSASSRAAATWGGSPARSSSPAGISHSRWPTGWRYWRISSTRSASSTASTGEKSRTHASAPSRAATAKAAAWADLTTNRERSNYELVAIAAGFWGPADRSLVEPYVERYFADVPPMREWLGEDALARVAAMTYPSRFVSDETLELSRATLARTDIDQGVRRSIVDAQSELEEALADAEAIVETLRETVEDTP